MKARPTPNDRILASVFGVHAIESLVRGKFNRMVAWQNRRVVDVAIDEAVNTYKVVDQNEGLVDTAFALGIYIGTT
jgi:6-phosphofructokinase 1